MFDDVPRGLYSDLISQLQRPRGGEERHVTFSNGPVDEGGVGGEQLPATPGSLPLPMTPAGLSRSVEMEELLAGALERVENDFAALKRRDNARDLRLKFLTGQINDKMKNLQDHQTRMSQAIQLASVTTSKNEEKMKAWIEDRLQAWKRSQQGQGVSRDQLQPITEDVKKKKKSGGDGSSTTANRPTNQRRS